MNIWALKKDNSIKHMLLMLTEALGAENFEILDSADTDECSIYLRHPKQRNVVAYIYTYGQSEEHYGIDLEFPLHDDSAIRNAVDSYENISFKRLKDILILHFDIIPASNP